MEQAGAAKDEWDVQASHCNSHPVKALRTLQCLGEWRCWCVVVFGGCRTLPIMQATNPTANITNAGLQQVCFNKAMYQQGLINIMVHSELVCRSGTSAMRT